MIYVTHDQVEAMTLADKIFVLQAGVVRQAGRPLDLYDDPDNRFVAGFIGSPSMNFLPGRVVGADRDRRHDPARGRGRPAHRRARLRERPATGTRVTLGMRPEHLEIAASAEAACRSRSTWRRTSAASPTCTPAPPPASPSCWSGAAAGRTSRTARSRSASRPTRALVFDEAGERVR